MKNKCVALMLVCLIAAALAISVGVCFAEDRDAANYAGTKSCRMCHKSKTVGNQYGVWEKGRHAKAVEVLASDESKAVAAKLGIDDPQKSGKCLKCHSTAYNFTEELQVEKITVDQGVTCESCHGPGKGYKASKQIMRDKQKCIEKGLIVPATKSCRLCHNDASPTWKADRYTDKDGKKVGFDEDEASEKIKHPRPGK